MNGAFAASWIGGLAQIFFLDLLLSGDNAILIALACRGLRRRDIPRAIFFGTAGAILLRVLLTTITGALITLPYLKLLCAVVLLVIAVNVAAAHAGDSEKAELDIENEGWRGDIIGAAMVVIIADAIMSLDNIVALAAVSKGNFWLLAAGLAVSIPLLVYGGTLLTGLLKLYPALIPLGGAVLGWTAGDLASGDPAIADWVSKQAPALIYVLPIAGAIFVLVQQSIAKQERSAVSRPALSSPKRRLRPRPTLSMMPQKAEVICASASATMSVPAAKPAQDPVRGDVARPLSELTPIETGGVEERVVLFGLIGLFLIVGIFVAVVLFVASGSFFAGG